MNQPSSETALRSAWRALLKWDPEPVATPGIEPHICRRPAIERAALIIRYRLFCLEHVLSPQGELREWAKLWMRICLVLSAPALLALPVLAAIANGLVDITAAGASICLNLLLILVRVIAIAFVLAAAAAFLRARMR